MLKLDWGDSQAWMTVAAELHNNTHSRLGQLPRRYPKENEFNVACVCAGYAFELIFKVLVKLGGKTPKPEHEPSKAYKDIPSNYCVEVKRIVLAHDWKDVDSFLKFLDMDLCNTDKKYWGQPPSGGTAKATFYLAGKRSINALYKLHVELSDFALDAINNDLGVEEVWEVSKGERRWLSAPGGLS